ncbi:MAG: CDP-alcohol phosphatidyltransferase family protein [Acidimicrobiia bacterium]|nr:CDP-alcohol phosphatidyltransferase family protein [Acidimicrobiia bacterium]
MTWRRGASRRSRSSGPPASTRWRRRRSPPAPEGRGGLGLSTPANIITLARIGASPVLFWLILRARDDGGASWLAVAVALVFAASDAWDGHLARNTGTVTRTGAFLDPLADKIVVLGSMASLAAIGRVSWIPVALIAAREVALRPPRGLGPRPALGQVEGHPPGTGGDPHPRPAPCCIRRPGP